MVDEVLGFVLGDFEISNNFPPNFGIRKEWPDKQFLARTYLLFSLGNYRIYRGLSTG